MDNAPSSQAPLSGNGYVHYKGSAADYPDPNKWADWDHLWNFNSKLIKEAGHDTSDQIEWIHQAILQIATQSGIDRRCILCIMMQESGGNVHEPPSTSPGGVHNTGLMQAYDGVSFNEHDQKGSITQMIKDGTEGTSKGPGLKQAYEKYKNYYECFRVYNSGEVDPKNLNKGFGATNDYVQSVANRLVGHVWPGM